jgi:hypothetical protein
MKREENFDFVNLSFCIERNRHFNELLSTTGHRLDNMAGDLKTYRSASENCQRLLEHEKGKTKMEKLLYCGLIFVSSPEPKAQVSFSDHILSVVRPSVRLSVCPSVRLSVRPSVNFYIFDFFSKTLGQF